MLGVVGGARVSRPLGWRDTTALDTHPGHISALERGNHHNHTLATRYQNWLTQHDA